MVDHLIIMACMAAVAIGLVQCRYHHPHPHVAQEDGMVLHFLTKLWGKLPTFLHKPLFTCPICMVSAWGMPAALWMGANTWMLPVYVLGAAGIVTACKL